MCDSGIPQKWASSRYGTSIVLSGSTSLFTRHCAISASSMCGSSRSQPQIERQTRPNNLRKTPRQASQCALLFINGWPSGWHRTRGISLCLTFLAMPPAKSQNLREGLRGGEPCARERHLSRTLASEKCPSREHACSSTMFARACDLGSWKSIRFIVNG